MGKLTNIETKLSVSDKIRQILGTDRFILLFEAKADEDLFIQTEVGNINLADLVWYEKHLHRFTNNQLDFIQYEATEEDIEYLTSKASDKEIEDEDNQNVTELTKRED
jgi:hypothetical protein